MCRELHERFMPEGAEPINGKMIGSILFILHKVIHSVSDVFGP